MVPFNDSTADVSSSSLDQVLRGNPGIVSSIAFHPTNEIGNILPDGVRKDESSKSSTKDKSCTEHDDDDTRKRNSSLSRRRHPCEQVASSSSDGTVMIFNIHENHSSRVDSTSSHGQNDASPSSTHKDHHEKVVRAYRYIGHRGPVHRIAYSPSGKVLASCSSDHTVRLWNPSRNYSKGDSVVLKGHHGPVRCVDFGHRSTGSFYSHSSDNDDGIESLLLTGSDDKMIKLWSTPILPIKKANFITSFVGHTNWVRVAKFCQASSANENVDGASNSLTSLAASGGDDKTVRIWSCERAVNLATYDYFGSRALGNNGGGVRDLHFLPSGMSLAACGTDGYTRLFDLRSDALVQNLDCNNSSFSSLSTVDCLSVHPDGVHLICSTSDSARDGR